MIDLLLAVAFIFIVMFLGLARGCSLYSPLFINSFSWLIAFLPGVVFYDKFYPLTETTVNAWFLWFSITSFCFFILQPSSLDNVYKHIEQPRLLPWRYSPIIVILAIWLGYRIWVVGNTGQNQFFLNLRLASNGIDEYGSLGSVMWCYQLVMALFIFEQLNYVRSRRAERWWLFFWLLLFAVGTMGKFAILSPIFIWVITAGIQKRISFLKIVTTVIISIALMLCAHFIRSGEGSNIDLLNMLAIYTYSPIVAFGYMDFPPPDHFAQYSLRFIYAIGYALDLTQVKPIDVIMDYVAVPQLTNVYTVLMPFYLDFGILGVAFFALIYSFLFGWLYSLVNKKNSFYLACYLALLMVLFSQFIIESLFLTLSRHIQIIIFLWVLYSISGSKSK